MAIIKYTSKDLDLMARLMRAEAVGEGDLGMLMVGNVIVNRVLANCLTFKNIDTIEKVVFQTPGGFAGINSNLFLQSSTEKEKELAKRILDGETYYPATHALWFYAPSGNNTCLKEWYNQKLVGRYKSHCFYTPDKDVCSKIY